MIDEQERLKKLTIPTYISMITLTSGRIWTVIVPAVARASWSF